MTFREAHHCVGQAVRYAIDQGRELNELSLAELQIRPQIQPDVFACLQARETINRRNCPGGTAEVAVRAAIQEAEKRLG
jgi:argininosuccinate lyase